VLMSPDQAAEFLSVPKRSLMDSYKRWGLPYVKVGKHVRFPTDGLQQWVDDRLSTVE
jgi:excisionase family DNA binding protein